MDSGCCIDASKSNDANKDYYCQDAVAFYKDAFEGQPNSKVEENIKRSAYGAMKVEIGVKLRATALERIDQKTPKMNEILTFMLSNIGMTLICIVGHHRNAGHCIYHLPPVASEPALRVKEGENFVFQDLRPGSNLSSPNERASLSLFLNIKPFGDLSLYRKL